MFVCGFIHHSVWVRKRSRSGAIAYSLQNLLSPLICHLLSLKTDQERVLVMCVALRKFDCECILHRNLHSRIRADQQWVTVEYFLERICLLLYNAQNLTPSHRFPGLSHLWQSFDGAWKDTDLLCQTDIGFNLVYHHTSVWKAWRLKLRYYLIVCEMCFLWMLLVVNKGLEQTLAIWSWTWINFELGSKRFVLMGRNAYCRHSSLSNLDLHQEIELFTKDFLHKRFRPHVKRDTTDQ